MVDVGGPETENEPEHRTLRDLHVDDFFLLVGEGVTEGHQSDACADGEPETKTEGRSGVSRRASR